jgi:hypothetical protein
MTPDLRFGMCRIAALIEEIVAKLRHIVLRGFYKIGVAPYQQRSEPPKRSRSDHRKHTCPTASVQEAPDVDSVH